MSALRSRFLDSFPMRSGCRLNCQENRCHDHVQNAAKGSRRNNGFLCWFSTNSADITLLFSATFSLCTKYTPFSCILCLIKGFLSNIIVGSMSIFPYNDNVFWSHFLKIIFWIRYLLFFTMISFFLRLAKAFVTREPVFKLTDFKRKFFIDECF